MTGIETESGKPVAENKHGITYFHFILYCFSLTVLIMGRISIKTLFLWWWWGLCAMKVTIRKTKNQRMTDTIDIVFRPTRFQSG